MNDLTIGKLARASGIGIETIRYYEREGLLQKPPRTESGYRQYSPEIVSRLRFIKHAKDLGFSLKEISELLSLKLHPRSSCARVKKKAEKKIEDIEFRIASLQRMRGVLSRLAKSCPGSGPTSDCPILEALEK
jgi:MerR family mercuric resistance operon transcriptional regulator